MKIKVQCWNGIGPTLNSLTVDIEAKNDDEAMAKAMKLTGMARAKVKKPFAIMVQ